MPSSFFGLNIAKAGLFSSQRGLHVSSHNIANANTEGYTRQRVDFNATSPDFLPGIGAMGTGVESQPIKQIRDEFLDFTFRGENALYGEYTKKYEAMRTIEGIINEPSNSGFTTLMNNYFSALQELNKNPESLTTRALVRERAISLTKGINGVSTSLKKLQEDLNFETKVAVDEINGYAQQIAKLNQIIYGMELDGAMANDIRDQRNLILDKLSEVVKINYYEDSEKRFHVAIQGYELVNHTNAKELVLKERTESEKLNVDDYPGLYTLEWKDGSTFNATGGRLKGIIDMRDNATGDNKGVPYYVETLNKFVDVFANAMNQVHASGYGLDKSTGTLLFTTNGMSTAEYETHLLTRGFNNGQPAVDVTASVTAGTSPTNTEAQNKEIMSKNIENIMANNNYVGKTVRFVQNKYIVVDSLKSGEITISKDVDTDLNKIAAGAIKDGIPGSGLNALNLANIRHDTSLFEWGSPDDFIKTLTSNLGVDGAEAKRISANQKVMLNNVETKRQSTSGVSLDEEMSEMLKFQHAYNANARMLTTMDGILDTLINRVGLAGR